MKAYIEQNFHCSGRIDQSGYGVRQSQPSSDRYYIAQPDYTPGPIDQSNYAGSKSGYLGSKAASGAYQAIISSMPPHDVYIEAFLGSGAILCNKQAAQKTIAIDKDPSLLDPANYPGVELLCCDAAAYIDQFDYASCGRVLIYADPPYLLSTRTSKARYKHDFIETVHIKLINILRSVPVSVILSGYPSRLYDELLHDWRTVQFQVMTRGGPM